MRLVFLDTAPHEGKAMFRQFGREQFAVRAKMAVGSYGRTHHNHRTKKPDYLGGIKQFVHREAYPA